MKKYLAVAAWLLCSVSLSAVTAFGAWREGLSAAQPYAGVPEVDLNDTMGYIMLYPRTKMPAEHFCDVLEIYLPREDVTRGEGTLQLYDENGLVSEHDFSDPDQVELRPLSEEEMEGLMWGGGTCICVHLPTSLTIGQNYYVHMDAGCFAAASGKVTSLPVHTNEAWVPYVTGDFGVNALQYVKDGAAAVQAQPATEQASEAEGEQTQAAAQQEAPEEAGEETREEPLELTLSPAAGDSVIFSLVLGGDAVSAVVYSENNSVIFDVPEYTQSAQVAGRIVSDDVNWGLVFLNEHGDVLDIISMQPGA